MLVNFDYIMHKNNGLLNLNQLLLTVDNSNLKMFLNDTLKITFYHGSV